MRYAILVATVLFGTSNVFALERPTDQDPGNNLPRQPHVSSRYEALTPSRHEAVMRRAQLGEIEDAMRRQTLANSFSIFLPPQGIFQVISSGNTSAAQAESLRLAALATPSGWESSELGATGSINAILGAAQLVRAHRHQVGADPSQSLHSHSVSLAEVTPEASSRTEEATTSNTSSSSSGSNANDDRKTDDTSSSSRSAS